ncbi:MAG: glycine--tRNA ligase subunit beta [Synergistaceae bacterium]|jgi:glycyl-tRNA synthetase beta chain|nr:glycine--tRNA ligase subunit beta [Synergistaceae bacterium]
MKRDLVLEIGTEEIPSRFIPPAIETLSALADSEFVKARVSFEAASVYATPRRLALCMDGVSEKQDDLVATIKGPSMASAFTPEGQPTRAAEGFAKSRGVSVADLKEIDVDGVKYAAAEVRERGVQTVTLLPGLFVGMIGKLVFPKNMYWSDPSVRFARPIRWITALFGDEVVPFEYGGVTSGRVSSGHRFMGKKRVEIRSASDFLPRLYDNQVLLDQGKRRQNLLAGIAALENEIDGTVERDPELVEENLYLVEDPVPFIGSFSERFLALPREVPITTMKKNQKYFAVKTKDGRLRNLFVGVSNNRAVDMSAIREGNERVLRARLEDAWFFWEEDRKRNLASNVERLKDVLYQEKLGSVHDKVMATRKLAMWICEAFGRQDISKLVERAAFLSKADLVSHMVYEFPELQGVMGREYAKLDGEDPRVALALYEQYLPKSASEPLDLPTDDVGAVLGIAERVLIIVNCHKVGLEPTGSQDPYALRRAARCVYEIIWGRKLDIDVTASVREAGAENAVPEEVIDASLSFMEQRLLVRLKEKGFEHELATLAISVAGDRPLQVMRLLDALNEVKDEPWFSSLVNAATRVNNILRKAEGEGADAVDPSLLAKPAEKALHDAVERTRPRVEEELKANDWKGLTGTLSELSPVVAGFFDDVMVMDSDDRVRANRLAILRGAGALFELVGLGEWNLGAVKAAVGA